MYNSLKLDKMKRIHLFLVVTLVFLRLAFSQVETFDNLNAPLIEHNFVTPFISSKVTGYQINLQFELTDPYGKYFNKKPHLKIEIFTENGILVKQIDEKEYDLGLHLITWNCIEDAGLPYNEGVYFFKITTSDDLGNSEEFTSFFVVGGAYAEISIPTENEELSSGIVTISGLAADYEGFSYFSLEYSQGSYNKNTGKNTEWIGIPVSEELRQFDGEKNISVLQVQNGELGIWDTRVLDDGLYTIRLKVVNRAGTFKEIYRIVEINNPLFILNASVDKDIFSPQETSEGTIRLEYDLTDTAEVFIEVKDANNNTVKTGTSVVQNKSTEIYTPAHIYFWDGKGDTGIIVPEGNYTISLKATGNDNTEYLYFPVKLMSSEDPDINISIVHPVENSTVLPNVGQVFTCQAFGIGTRTKPLRVKISLTVSGTVKRKTIYFPVQGGPFDYDLTSAYTSIQERNLLGPFPYLDSKGNEIIYDNGPLFIRSDGPVNQLTLPSHVKETEGEIKVFYENATPLRIKTITTKYLHFDYTTQVDLTPFATFNVDVLDVKTKPNEFFVDLFTQTTNFSKTYEYLETVTIFGPEIKTETITRYMGPVARLRWMVNAPKTFYGESIPYSKSRILYALVNNNDEGIVITDEYGVNYTGVSIRDILKPADDLENDLYTIQIEGVGEPGTEEINPNTANITPVNLYFANKGPAASDRMVTDNEIDIVVGVSTLRTPFTTDDDERLTSGLVHGKDYILDENNPEVTVLITYSPPDEDIEITTWDMRLLNKKGEYIQTLNSKKVTETEYIITGNNGSIQQYIDINGSINAVDPVKGYQISVISLDGAYRHIIKKREVMTGDQIQSIWDVTDVLEGEYNIHVNAYTETGFRRESRLITLLRPYTGIIQISKDLFSPADDILEITAFNSKDSLVSLDIQKDSSLIKSVIHGTILQKNELLEIMWDGTDVSGLPVADGIYQIIFHAQTLKKGVNGQSLDAQTFSKNVEVKTGHTVLDICTKTSSSIVTPNSDGINDSLIISISNNTAARIGVKVRNENGEIVKVIQNNDVGNSYITRGERDVLWDVTDTEGNTVSSGTYEIVINGFSFNDIYEKTVIIPITVEFAGVDNSISLHYPPDGHTLTGDNGAYYSLLVRPVGYEYPEVKASANFYLKWEGAQQSLHSYYYPYYSETTFWDDCGAYKWKHNHPDCHDTPHASIVPLSTASMPGNIYHYVHNLDSFAHASTVSGFSIAGTHIDFGAYFTINTSWWGSKTTFVNGHFILYYELMTPRYWDESTSFSVSVYEKNNELFIPDKPPSFVSVAYRTTSKRSDIKAFNPENQSFLELSGGEYYAQRKGHIYYLKSKKTILWDNSPVILGANTLQFDPSKSKNYNDHDATLFYPELAGPVRDHVYITNFEVSLNTSSKGVYLECENDEDAADKPTFINTKQGGKFKVVLDRERERRYIDILGYTGNDTSSYKLYQAKGTNVKNAKWDEIPIDEAFPDNNTLCRWDTTFLYGKYLLLLQVTKNNGNLVETTSRVNIGNIASREGGGNATSPFGTVRVDFPPNAIPEDAQDMLPETPFRDVLVDILPINRDDMTIENNFSIIGPVFSMRPAGIVFDEPATLTYQYTDELGENYLNTYGPDWESRLGTYHVKDNGTIDYLPGYVDKNNNKIIVRIPGFSDYALVFDKTQVPQASLDTLPSVISYFDIKIKGNAAINHEIIIRLNDVHKGIVAVEPSGYFEFTGLHLNSGENELQIITRNSRGVDSIPIKKIITVDTVRPVVGITGDKTQYISKKSVTGQNIIQVTMNKTGKILLMVNEQTGLIYKTKEFAITKDIPLAIDVATLISIGDASARYFLYVKGVDYAGNVNVDNSGKQIELIVDTEKPQITFATLRCDTISTGETNGLGIVDYNINDNASKEIFINAQVLNSKNEVITTLKKWEKEFSGDLQIIWNGRDKSGFLYPDDIYTIAISAADRSGNISDEYKLSIGIDGSSPVEDQFVSLQPRYINNSFSKGILKYIAKEPHTVKVTVINSEGSVVNEQITSQNSEIDQTIILPFSLSSGSLPVDGTYRIDVTFIDLSGNVQQWADFLYVDTTQPLISITSPFEDQKVSGILDIKGEINDSSFDSFEVVLINSEGAQASLGKGFSPVIGNNTIVTFDSGGLTGEYTLQLCAIDKAGNSTTNTRNIKFANTLENNLVTVGLEGKTTISHFPGSPDQNIYVNITARADCQVFVSIYNTQDEEVRKIVLPKDILANEEINTLWNGLDSDKQIIDDGSYVLRVSAASGTNTTVKDFSILVDSQNPEVTITSPVDNQWIKSTIPITGNIVEENLEKYTVEILSSEDQNKRQLLKTGYQLGNGIFYELNTLGLDEGFPYEIFITAIDKAGNEAGTRFRVRADRTPPSVKINPINEKNIIRSGTAVNLYGAIEDNHFASGTISIKKPGESVYTDIASLSESLIGSLLEIRETGLSGIYEVKISAVDEAGNTTSHLYTFTVVQPMLIAHINNMNQEINMLNGDFLIKGSASGEDFKNYILSYSDQEYGNYVVITKSENQITDSGLGIWNTRLDQGHLYLKLEVSDTFGEKAEIIKQVYIDNEKPVVSVSSPTYNFITKDSIPLSFAVIDDLLISKVEVSFENATQSEKILEEYVSEINYYYNTPINVEDKNGDYTLNIRTYDTAGNSQNVGIPVIIDTQKPVVTITDLFPDLIHPLNISKAALLYFDLSEKSRITVSVGSIQADGTFSIVRKIMDDVLFEKGAYNVSWNARDALENYVPDGTYTFKISARDRVDNLSDIVNRDIRVLHDTEPPQIVFNSQYYLFSPQLNSKKDNTLLTCSISDNKFDEMMFSLEIVDQNNLLVKEIFQIERVDGGQYQSAWNGLDNNGQTVLDGSYNVRTYIRDGAGNTRDENIAQITIDNTKPIIDNISIPVTYISPGILDGKSDETSLHASISEPGVLTITINNNNNEVVQNLITERVRKDNYVYYLRGVTDNNQYLPDGIYTVVLNCEDIAGNDAITKYANFVIDNTYPSISFNELPIYLNGNAEINAPVVEQNIKEIIVSVVDLEDSQGVYTEIGRRGTIPSDNIILRWNTLELNKLEGIYNIKIDAVDKSYNKKSVDRFVRVDNKSPDVALSIKQDAVQNIYSGELTFVASVNDRFIENYQLFVGEGVSPQNWTPIALIESKIDDPYTSREKNIVNEQIAVWKTWGLDNIYTIKLVATDKVGNVSEAQLSIDVDSIAPVISELHIDPDLQSVSLGQVVKSTYSIDEDAKTTVEILSENALYTYTAKAYGKRILYPYLTARIRVTASGTENQLSLIMQDIGGLKQNVNYQPVSGYIQSIVQNSSASTDNWKMSSSIKSMDALNTISSYINFSQVTPFAYTGSELNNLAQFYNYTVGQGIVKFQHIPWQVSTIISKVVYAKEAVEIPIPEELLVNNSQKDPNGDPAVYTIELLDATDEITAEVVKTGSESIIVVNVSQSTVLIDENWDTSKDTAAIQEGKLNNNGQLVFPALNLGFDENGNTQAREHSINEEAQIWHQYQLPSAPNVDIEDISWEVQLVKQDEVTPNINVGILENENKQDFIIKNGDTFTVQMTETLSALRTVCSDLPVAAGGVDIDEDDFEGLSDTGSILPDGHYLYKITLKDVAGNTGSMWKDFDIDSTPPVISINYPENNAVLNGLFSITGSIEDNFLLDTYQIYLKENSAQEWIVIKEGINAQSSGTLGSIDCALYNSGDYKIKYIAQDKAGNSQEKITPVTLYSDQNQIVALLKSAQFISPNEDNVLDSFTLEYRLLEDAKVTLKLFDGENNEVDVLINAVDIFKGDRNYEITGLADDGTSLEDGDYRLELTAVNGVTVGQRNIIFTIDTTPPVVNINEPSENTFIRDVVSLSGSLYDPHFSSASVSYKKTGGAFVEVFQTQKGSYNDNQNHFLTVLKFQPEDDVYIIRLKVEDNAGNIGEFFRTVQRDTTAPDVTLDLQQLTHINNSIGIHYSTYDPNPSSWSIRLIKQYSDTLLLSADANSSDILTINSQNYPDGRYTLQLRSTDLNHNISVIEKILVIDNTRPIVSIAAPIDNSVLRGVVSVTGNANDINLVSYTLGYIRQNNEDVTNIIRIATQNVTDNVIAEFDTSGLNETVRLIIQVQDMAGNTSFLDRSIVLDNTAPVVSVTSPSANETLSGEILVTGTVSDDYLSSGIVSYAYNNSTSFTQLEEITENVSDGFLATFKTDSLLDGVYKLRVEASDIPGNATYREISLSVDNNAPNVIVESPANNAEYTGVITITGTIYDYLLSSYEVGIKHSFEDQYHSIAQGNENILSANICQFDSSLFNGNINLKITARDAAGKETVLTRNFRIDNASPVLNIVSPAKNPYTPIDSTQSLVVSVSEPAIIHALVKNSHGNIIKNIYTSESFPAGNVEILWNGKNNENTIVESGTYSVEVYAIDNFGHKSETLKPAFEVLYDVIAPDVSGIAVYPKDLTFNAQSVLLQNTKCFIQGPVVENVSSDLYHSILLFDNSGTTCVATILTNEVHSPGDYSYSWNGYVKVNGETVKVSDGLYKIYFFSKDKSGNGSSIIHDISVDSTAPIVTATFPRIISTDNDSGPWDIVSEIQNGSEDYTIQILLRNEFQFILKTILEETIKNGNSLTVSFDGKNTDGNYLDEGSYEIITKVYDKRGNLTEVASPFLIDNAPPQVVITTPSEDLFFIGYTKNENSINGTIPISLSITETSPVSLTLRLKHNNDVIWQEETRNIHTDGTLGISFNRQIIDGIYQIEARVVDQAGLTGNTSSVFKIDSTAPLGTAVINSLSYQDMYVNAAYNVIFQSIDPEVNDVFSDIKEMLIIKNDDIDNSITIDKPSTQLSLDPGTNNYKFLIYDNAQNESEILEKIIILDTVPPVVLINANTIPFIKNENIYYPANSVFNLTATDDYSGVNKTLWQLDADSEIEGSVIGSVTTEGVHRIQYYGGDNVENVSSKQTFSFIIDNSPPETTFSVSAQILNILNSNYLPVGSEITFTAADTYSGVKNIYYKINNNDFIKYENPVNLNTSGTFVIEYYAEDNLGHIENSRAFIVTTPYPDMTPPETTLHLSQVPYVGNFQEYLNLQGYAKLTAIDKLGPLDGTATGVAGIEYKIDTEENWTAYGSLDKITFSEGIHTLYYRSYDFIPNIEKAQSKTISIDGIAPVTAAELKKADGTVIPIVSENVVGSGYTLKLTAIDTLMSGVASGVKRIEYHIDNLNWKIYNNAINLQGINKDNFTLTYRAIDNVQNTEIGKTIVFIKDVTPPVVALYSPFTGDIVNCDIPVFGEVTDPYLDKYTLLVINAQGIETIINQATEPINGMLGIWPLTGTIPSLNSPGDYRIKLVARDRTGNESSTETSIRFGEPEHIVTFGENRNSHNGQKHNAGYWSFFHKYKIDKIIRSWGNLHQMQGFVPYDDLKLGLPTGLDFSVNDFIYVADESARLVRILDGMGNQLSTFNHYYDYPAVFLNLEKPTAVAFTREGNYYVADLNANWIHYFRYNGKYEYSIGKGGVFTLDLASKKEVKCTPSSAEGSFKKPSAVAVDRSGQVFVADTGNSRVQIFNADGTFRKVLSGFSAPEGISVITRLGGSVEELWIADTGHNRLEVYTVNGDKIGSFTGTSTQGIQGIQIVSSKNIPLSRPQDVSFDNNGQLVVVDEIYISDDKTISRLHRYDRYFNVITVFSNIITHDGKAEKYFNQARGITFDTSKRHMILSDSRNHQVYKLKLTTLDYIDSIAPVANLRTTIEKNHTYSHHHGRYSFKKSSLELGYISIYGEAADAYFSEAVISFGAGENPAFLTVIERLDLPVWKGLLTKWNITDLAIGRYTMKLDVYDLNGNVSSDSMILEITGDKVDITKDEGDSGDIAHYNQPPESPQNIAVNRPYVKADEEVIITWAFSDADVGDLQSGYEYIIHSTDGSVTNKVISTQEAVQTVCKINSSTLGTDGQYEIIINVYDSHGAVSSNGSSVSFVLDTAAPEINIKEPGDGGNYKGSVKIDVAVNDVNIDTVHAALNGTNIALNTTLSETGTHQLAVTARDLAGNASIETCTFSITEVQTDTDPIIITPEIVVCGITNEICYRENVHVQISFAGSFIEKHIFLNGIEQTMYLENGDYSSLSLDYENDGVYVLRIKAADIDGYLHTLYYSNTIDRQAPVVVCNNILDNSYVQPIIPDISVTDAQNGSCTVTILLDNNPYTAGTLISENGLHLLKIIAHDNAGNTITNSVSFVVDGVAPVINIAGITDGQHYAEDKTVNVSVIDINPKTTTITLNSVLVNSPYTVTSEGAYTNKVVAVDKANNPASRVDSFTIDKTLPVVVVEGIESNKVYLKPSIKAKIYEPNLWINGSQIYLDTTSLMPTITISTDEFNIPHYQVSVSNITNVGDHSFTYSVSDKAHNVVQDSLIFTVTPFDCWSNLSAYASFDTTANFDIASGDKNQYSYFVFYTDPRGYISNCFAPGETLLHRLFIYKSENNISPQKGTLSFWMKPDWNQISHDDNYLFTLKNSTSSAKDVYSLRAYMNEHKGLVFNVKNHQNTEFELAPEEGIPDANRWYASKEWTYITFTWDYTLSEMNVYMNGEKKGTQVISGTPKNNEKWFILGAAKEGYFWGECTLQGFIDEVKIYDKALNDTEVRYIFEYYNK